MARVSRSRQPGGGSSAASRRPSAAAFDAISATRSRSAGRAANVSRRLDRSRGRADSSARRPVIRSTSAICRSAERRLSRPAFGGAVEQRADCLMARLRGDRRARRMMQPMAQQAAAHRGAAGVEQRIERRRFGAAQRLGEFEIAPRRRIEPDVFGFVFDLEAAHVAKLLALRGRRVDQQRARRAVRARECLRAEAVEACDFELIAEALRARRDIEVPRGHARDRAHAGRHRFDRAVGRENLGGPDTLERRAELIRRELGEPQRAAREIEPGEADVRRDAAFVVADAQREQKHVALVGQQRGVGQRARRHDAHDLALDGAFRRRGVADLFADRRRFAEFHELREVLLDRVMRHARHLDRRAGGCAALRERQVEQTRGFFRVFEEELVEVAHPVEHERVGVLRLDA